MFLLSSLQPVGCDGSLYSARTMDRCRVCGGDGSTCHRVSGSFRKAVSQIGTPCYRSPETSPATSYHQVARRVAGLSEGRSFPAVWWKKLRSANLCLNTDMLSFWINRRRWGVMCCKLGQRGFLSRLRRRRQLGISLFLLILASRAPQMMWRGQ